MLVSFLSSPVLLLVLWVFGTAFLPLSDWNHSVSSTYLANCRHQVQVHWYRHTSNLSWTVKIQNIIRMFQMDMSAIYHISTWINCHRLIYILKGICTKTVFQKYFDLILIFIIRIYYLWCKSPCSFLWKGNTTVFYWIMFHITAWTRCICL